MPAVAHRGDPGNDLLMEHAHESPRLFIAFRNTRDELGPRLSQLTTRLLATPLVKLIHFMEEGGLSYRDAGEELRLGGRKFSADFLAELQNLHLEVVDACGQSFELFHSYSCERPSPMVAILATRSSWSMRMNRRVSWSPSAMRASKVAN